MQRERGFTLIEAMIAVVILALLASISIPNMSGYLKSRRVVGAAEAIYSQIIYARSEAIARSTDVTVNIAPGASDVWVLGVSDDTDCDPNIDDSATLNACVLTYDGTPVLKRLDGDEFEDVEVDTGGLNRITFDPVRGVASDNGTISVTLGGFDVRIVVGLIGRARICTPTNTGSYEAC